MEGKKYKILITGTAGFIGFHLVQRLLNEGHHVTGLDNINAYYDVQLKLDRLKTSGIDSSSIRYNKLIQSTTSAQYQFIQLNLEDLHHIEAVFQNFRPEIVIHLAAQAGVRYSIENPASYISSNITGFHNVLECCRKFQVNQLIYASSSSVYGNNKKTPFSEDDSVDHPVSLYAATKKSNELLAHCYSHLYGFPTIGLRFFTVYGPWGRPDMAYFRFTDAILKEKPLKVYNYGNLSRDFTYIGDIVTGISDILKNPEGNADSAYNIYNIGNNQPVLLMDFISEIENILEKKAIKQLLPMQAGDVEITFADIEKIHSDYGFTPATTLREGLTEFISWYKTYYNFR